MIEHIIRYGTPGDAPMLSAPKYRNHFDALALNATIVAHAPSAIAKFVSESLSTHAHFIDPLTHAVQHDLSYISSKSSGKGIKSSIRKLLENYGQIAQRIVLTSEHPLRPEHLTSDADVDDFCSGVIAFQEQYLSDFVDNSETGKYISFLQSTGAGISNPARPSRIIAPYFFFEFEGFRDFLSINLRLAERALRYCPSDCQFGVQIVLPKDVAFDETLRGEIVRSYAMLEEVSFIFLWVDNFDESTASLYEIVAFGKLVQQLATIAPVTNLYGGYFSLLLGSAMGNSTLSGVAHGLEYGEARGVVPVGGGIPVAKYYVPRLHLRVPFRQALRVIRELDADASPATFHQRICGCPECRRNIVESVEDGFFLYGDTWTKVIQRKDKTVVREFTKMESRQKSVRHYLWAKSNEHQTVDVDHFFDESTEMIGALGSTVPDVVYHLHRWRRALAQLDLTSRNV